MDAEELLDALRDSTRQGIGLDREVGVAYSGGLDSSIVATLASEHAKTNCYAWAVEGSFDASTALARGEEDRLRVRVNLLEPERLERAVVSTVAAIRSSEPIKVAYSMPIVLVLEESPERMILAGNLADELFGGYSKYARVANPEERMHSDLQKARLEADRLRCWASSLQKGIFFPFSDNRVASIANTIPLSRKISSDDRKIVLREVARLLGLPSHDRPKKAAQYSSGILKMMRRMSKDDGLSLTQWTHQLACDERRKHL